MITGEFGEPRLEDVVLTVRQRLENEGVNPTAEFDELDFSVVLRAVRSGEVAHTVRTSVIPSGPSRDDALGWIVAHEGRELPTASFKPANLVHMPSRLLQVAALIAVVEATLANKDPALRVFAAMVGLGFAGFAALRVGVGYSEACVLHKAWKIAGQRQSKAFTLEEILNVRAEISVEYQAPKCAGDAEIRDALRGLQGIRAVRLDGQHYVLEETITFFSNGGIKN